MNLQRWQQMAVGVLFCTAWCFMVVGPSAPSAAESLTQAEMAELADISNDQPGEELDANELLRLVKISAGWEHTCALTTGGGVKCWGYNVYGQLGDGGAELYSEVPVDVVGLTSGVTDIHTSNDHACALTANGGVKCWGLNRFGQLGDGTDIQRSTPVDVTGLTSGVIAITAGGHHTCALTSAGGLKCWGYNGYGQLGDGTEVNRYTPADVIGLAGRINTISAGGFHTCALTGSGAAWCWGDNYNGELGDGTTNHHSIPTRVLGLSSGVAEISAGRYHTCARISSGGVKCWGGNIHGEVGDGTSDNIRLVPVDVIGLANGVTDVSAGYEHTCAVTEVGGVMCWGSNILGMLGDGTIIDRTIPVDVVGLASGTATVTTGFSHTCALTTTRLAKCWGDPRNGRLGNGLWFAPRSISFDVVNLEDNLSAISAGEYHTCVVTTGGGVKCWGYNAYGQLGSGTVRDSTSSPTDVVGLTNGIIGIANSYRHTCALTSAGGVKCWGDNEDGQLGNGTWTESILPVDVINLANGINDVDIKVTAITVGGAHTCALTSYGGVKCWGINYSGELGDGTWISSNVPVDVVGLSNGVIAIAAGYDHTCALTSTGVMKCWGWNMYGQLGNGTTNNSPTPVDVLGLPSGVVAIEAGGLHSCALVTVGDAKCWGYNNHGQLGDGTLEDRYIPVSVIGLNSDVNKIDAGGMYTCALTTGGGAQCWGRNDFGQLGDSTREDRLTPVDLPGLSSSVITINGGANHTCALVGNGRAKCWGSNSEGQAGDGRILQFLTPIDVVGSIAPVLTTNYHVVQPGTVLTLTGWNYTPGELVTLSINGEVITAEVQVNPTGSFIVFLDTTGAESGAYQAVVSANTSAAASFYLDDAAPSHNKEGGGKIFALPAGLAYSFSTYLPVVSR